jgi:DGQHR domain-containing protein
LSFRPSQTSEICEKTGQVMVNKKQVKPALKTSAKPAAKMAAKSAAKTAKKDVKVFDCIPIRQGTHTIYLFAAKASELWSVVSINERQEDKEEGYQRVLSPSRVRALANYIKSGKTLPLSVLVTFDNATVSSDGKTLTVPNQPDAGWVIDGQHRLAGAHESKFEIDLPVVAFVGLDIDSQIQQFVTINREAKGVPASLYYELLKHLPKKNPGDVAKERAVDLASDLKRDEDSPFFGKIVTTSVAGKGEISLNNFVRKVHPLLVEAKGHLSAFSLREQKQIIANYYKGVQNVFPKEFNKPDSIFFQTLGFGGLIGALPTFVNLCVKHYKKFRVEDVTQAFMEIKHFDFTGWNQLGTGTAAENQAGEDLKTELLAAFDTAGKDGGAIQLV